MTNSLFTAEQIVELELELISVLRSQGLIIEEIKLIGLKGSGYHATVFSVLINNIHHVLKAYREPEAFRRESRHLHKVIPNDRFLFIWKADENRFGLNIVIIEVPDGAELTYRDLLPEVSKRLAAATIALHSLRSRHKVSMKSLRKQIEHMRPGSVAHAEAFPDINPGELSAELSEAQGMTTSRRDILRVRRTRTHGDLWWANIIVAAEDVYLIDWERLRMADFAEDLAKMRILFNIVRPSEPRTIWHDQPVNTEAIDAFMEAILCSYEAHFTKRNIRFRYGFYCLVYGYKFFSDYYNEEKHGTPEALAMLQDGRVEFNKYCRGLPIRSATISE